MSKNNVVLRREPCPSCRAKGRDKSGNNRIIYSDESYWCFVCEKGLIDPTEKEPQLYETEEIMDFGKADWDKLRNICTKHKEDSNPFQAFGYRGITDETYKLFGVINRARLNENDEPIISHQYYPILKEIDGQDQICGAKVRTVDPKGFSVKGENRQATSYLFGQYLAKRSGKKTVVIAAGECFTGNVEVMTDKGFIKFKDISKLENDFKVLTIDPNTRDAKFLPPVAIIEKDYTGQIMTSHSKHYSVSCTREHNLAFSVTKNEPLVKQEAWEEIPRNYKTLHSVYSNNEGEEQGLPFTDEEIVLIATLSFTADHTKTYKKYNNVFTTTYSNSEYTQSLKKALKDVGIKYKLIRGATRYVSFVVPEKFLPVVQNSSFLIPIEWITKATRRQLELILDTQIKLSCTDRTFYNENILWVRAKAGKRQAKTYWKQEVEKLKKYYQTICALSGRYLEGVEKQNQSKNLSLFRITSEIYRPAIRVEKQKTFRAATKTKVYCVQSYSGYIMIRYKGRVSVVGNCDAMATFQMLQSLGQDCPAVVSSTVGEKGVNQYRAQYNFFDSFDKIIIIPDQDKAGLEALKEAVQALPRNKVYVVELPKKDPNDMLMAGLATEFIKRYRDAKPYVPDGVVGSGELYNKIIEASNVTNIPIPDFMIGLKTLFPVGFALESIMNLVAASGIGKSSFINQIIYYWIFNAPYKVGVLSLELSGGQYGLSLLSTHLKVKLNNMTTEERLEYLAQENVIKKANELFLLEDGSNRFYLIDERSNKLEHVQKMIEQLIISCGCKILVIDPLQDLFSGASLGEEQEFMAWQKSIIKQYGVLIVNVCHTRKAGAGEKSGSTGGMISEESIAGSSDVYKSASVNILFTRDKLSEDPIERNRTYCYVSKNRWSSSTGEAGSFYYSSEENWLYDFEEYKKLYPEKFVEDLEEGIDIGY